MSNGLPLASLIFYVLSAGAFSIIFVLEDSKSCKALVLGLLIMTLFLYAESLRMFI